MHDMVAILMATYNGEKYIREQLDSLLDQTYKNFRIYIHDDGSTDRTTDIIREYAEKHPGKIAILEGAPTGSSKLNFLYLMKNVTADQYMCCDQDDVWLKNKVEVTLHHMKNIPDNERIPCLVHTDLKVVDKELRVISPSMDRYQRLNSYDQRVEHLLVQNCVTGCTMMFNNPMKDSILKYKNADSVIMHDWWAAIIAAYFGRLVYIDKPLILYRQHDSNAVGAKRVTYRDIFRKLSKKERTRLKHNLYNTRRQAWELARVFRLEKDTLPYIYAANGRNNKLKRIYTYRKYRFKNSNFIKNLGFYLLG